MPQSTAGSKAFTWRQGLLVGIVVGLVVGAMAAIAGVAIASYNATGAAEVLGVVMPALSAVVGAAVGGGAGVAAGSAGKQAVQTQLATTRGTLQAAASEVDGLQNAIADLHGPLRTQMESPQGVAAFRAAPDTPGAGVEFRQFDDVTARLAHLKAVLGR